MYNIFNDITLFSTPGRSACRVWRSAQTAWRCWRWNEQVTEEKRDAVRRQIALNIKFEVKWVIIQELTARGEWMYSNGEPNEFAIVAASLKDLQGRYDQQMRNAEQSAKTREDTKAIQLKVKEMEDNLYLNGR